MEDDQKLEVYYSGDSNNRKQIKLQMVEKKSKATIDITDMQRLNVFSCKDVCLSRINIKALQQAFSQVNKSISYKIQYKSSQNKDEFMLLTINIAMPFIHEINQTIILEKTSTVSKIDILTEKLININNQIKNQGKPKNKKIVSQKSELIINAPEINNGLFGLFEQQGTEEFTELIGITLPEKGKYLVTLSMLIKAQNSFTYLYQDRNYSNLELGFVNGGIYTPDYTHFIPFVRTTIVNSPLANFIKSYSLYDTYDYPTHFKNIIVTAQKIHD